MFAYWLDRCCELCSCRSERKQVSCSDYTHVIDEYRKLMQGIPGGKGPIIASLYPTPAQACGLEPGLQANPATDCRTFFNCSAAMGPQSVACPEGTILGSGSTSCTPPDQSKCPALQPVFFTQGIVVQTDSRGRNCTTITSWSKP